MSETILSSKVAGLLSLADAKLLVRQLKAIDAESVQLEANGSSLVARASGVDVLVQKTPCARHSVYSPKCEASDTYKDRHGHDQIGCRSRTQKWQAEMSLKLDVDGSNALTRKASVSLKTVAGIVKAHSKLKSSVPLTMLAGAQWH